MRVLAVSGGCLLGLVVLVGLMDMVGLVGLVGLRVWWVCWVWRAWWVWSPKGSEMARILWSTFEYTSMSTDTFFMTTFKS